MENYTKTNIGSEARVELHEKLGLTGAEVSINQLPAGAGVPFVHAHRNNEEIYGIIAGKGKAVIDGKEIALTAGDWLKVAPAAKRQFSAAADEGITYICIQVKNTLWAALPLRMPLSSDRKSRKRKTPCTFCTGGLSCWNYISWYTVRSPAVPRPA